jgi:hypothetical protein
MDKRLEKYYKAKSAVKSAKKWNDLPNGQRYQGDTFPISIAHCSAPKLVRCGQQYAGGKNYWDTDEPLNNAILKYIVDKWDDISPDIFAILEKKEADALLECQTFIDEMQAEINKFVNSQS